MAALLAGYGVYASLLNVTGQAGTGLQTGTDDSASVSVGCQTAPVQVRPVYEEKFTAATGFDVPLTAFEISGVQATCVTAKSAWVLAVELGGSFRELDDVLVLADAVSVGSGVYRIKPEPITAVASMGITGYSIRAAPEEKPPAPGLWVAPGDTTGLAYVYEPQTQAPWPIAEYEYSLFIDTGNAWTAVGALGEWTTLPISRPGPTQLSLSGLTNGALYQVRVRALNKISPYERFISNVATYDFIPRTTPDAPTGLIATAGDSQISVAFTAPAFNGGASINNYEYSLDNGTTWTVRSPSSTTSPLVITGLTNGTAYQVRLRAVNVAGPSTASTAVSATPVPTVFAFGDNAFGKLGDGTTDTAYIPEVINAAAEELSGKNITQISAGHSHSCALDDAGKAYCWGKNSNGQLGDGTNTNSLRPVAVASAQIFTRISAGQDHTCAVTNTGAAYCWGLNGNGQLGNNSTTASSSPVEVWSLSGISINQISASADHTCALDNASKAYCWGSNSYGKLGNGSETQSTTPVAVDHARSYATISAGLTHTCAVAVGGSGYCWGWNGMGQLGDGTTTPRSTPTAVAGGRTFTQISTGQGYHSCAVESTGRAYCWGENKQGQLGNGTTNQGNTSNPVAVSISWVLWSKTLTQVSVGASYTCAISTDESAYCWGDNSSGQFGNNSSTSSTTPVAAGWDKLFTQIDAGNNHTIGLS